MIAAKCMVSLMTERNIETISGCYKTMAKYWLTCVVNCMCIDKIHLRKCDLRYLQSATAYSILKSLLSRELKRMPKKRIVVVVFNGLARE